MNSVERFCRVMRFETVDRLPCIEFAPWWNLTLDCWRTEGLPNDYAHYWTIAEHLGLEPMRMLSVEIKVPPVSTHGSAVIDCKADYDQIRPDLYGGTVRDVPLLYQSVEQHRKGELLIGLHFYGFFWMPRSLLGIAKHLYAFYDYPDLMRRINLDGLEFNIRILQEFLAMLTPEFLVISEDMAYNHGPMCSKEMFDTFILPYYQELTPLCRQKGIPIFVDCDGMIEPMIPWFKKAGVDGILPLERMAGVDVGRIRKNHPDFLMIGGFDKTVMKFGATAMRGEFERILPTMRSGGYIPSVDHQTPPDVSLENYRAYLLLLHEYAEKAAYGNSAINGKECRG